MNLEFRQHRLAPLITVTVAAMVFAILLIAVRLQWAPLESADHGAAAEILLVFLPAARGRRRTAFITVIVALIALIGISRIRGRWCSPRSGPGRHRARHRVLPGRQRGIYARAGDAGRLVGRGLRGELVRTDR